MLIMLFRSVEDAINQLSIIKESLMKLHEDYGRILEKMKMNADVEEKLVRMGFQPSHSTITVQAIPHPINIHLAPHSSWLLNKLSTINNNIDYVIKEIDKINNYLSTIKMKNVAVLVMIDYTNKKSRLVMMP